MVDENTPHTNEVSAESSDSAASDNGRETIIKAHFIGRDGTEQSNVLETDEATRRLFSHRGAVEPPIDPVTLAHLFEMSGALRSNIDAYAMNIDGFGHTLKPTIDLDADDTFDKVKQAILEERILGVGVDVSPEVQAKRLLHKELDAPNIGNDGVPTGAGDQDDFDVVEPTDQDVQARIASISREMLREKMRLDRFFDFCCVDESFTSLRKRTRQDLELLGNAYWEVLRNANGDIVQFTYIPSFTMRLLPQEKSTVEVKVPIRVTPITEAAETLRRRFRTFLQVVESKSKTVVYFKEFGDPRVTSSKTGYIYDTEKDMLAAERDAVKATEVIHFKVHNSRTPYGVPRWISEMISVLGNRNADEINLAYFENRAIPPMILTVSGGGRLGKDSVTRFENYFKNQLRGKRHHHSIAILEADTPSIMGATGTGNVKIDVIKLRDAQQEDAMFLKYRETNTEAIGSVFRVPKLLRGDVRDFNRATAETALEFAESQVFAPLRQDFDFIINRSILADFGVRFWSFESNGPDFSNPEDLLRNANEASRAGYLTPNELRKIASKGFRLPFEPVDDAWADERPLAMTLEGLRQGRTDMSGKPEDFEPSSAQPAPVGPIAAPEQDAADDGPAGDDVKKSYPGDAYPSPQDYAREAARLISFKAYADRQGFFDSHKKENE